jgi:hypothetical protein
MIVMFRCSIYMHSIISLFSIFVQRNLFLRTHFIFFVCRRLIRNVKCQGYKVMQIVNWSIKAHYPIDISMAYMHACKHNCSLHFPLFHQIMFIIEIYWMDLNNEWDVERSLNEQQAESSPTLLIFASPPRHRYKRSSFIHKTEFHFFFFVRKHKNLCLLCS